MARRKREVRIIHRWINKIAARSSFFLFSRWPGRCLAGKTIPGFRIDPIWFGSSCVGYNCAGQPSRCCCCCRALQPLLLAAGTRTGARRKPYLVLHTLVFSSFYTHTHTHLECVVAGCCCFVCLLLLRPCVNYVIRSGHRLGSGWLVVYLPMGERCDALAGERKRQTITKKWRNFATTINWLRRCVFCFFGF